MLSLGIVTLAAAVLCWPSDCGQRRLRRLRSRWRAPEPGRLGASSVGPSSVGPSSMGRLWVGRLWVGRLGVGRHWLAVAVTLAAGCGALLAGLGGGLAAAMAAGTAALRWRAGRDRQAGTAAVSGLVDGLAVLVAELRAGAQVADAAVAAATEGPPSARRVLSAAAAAARLGGAVPAVLRSTGPAPLRPWLGRLADAWSLADRHGIPLADLLDAVRADLEQRVRFAAEVQARLAGPRATAAVLAGLPLLGLVLGQAMGAAPLRVLGQTAAGQVLLVVGTGLACAGVLWSARLVTRVGQA